MKKVVHIITKSNWGGAQRYVYDMATGLPKDGLLGGYESVVIAGGNGPLITKLEEAGIRTITIPSLGRDVSPLKDFSVMLDLIKMLRSEKPDIVHLNSSKIGGLGALAARFVGVKHIVFTAHGWAFNEDRKFSTKLLIKLSYWVILFLAHKVIAVSQTAANQVLSWPGVKDKTTVVHNSIRTEASYASKGAITMLTSMNESLKVAVAKDPSLKHTIWIGTIAELHPIKGQVYAIEAIRQVIDRLAKKKKNYRILFTIIGEGQERSKLENKIKELGLSENVFLLGNIPQASQYLKAFDIFLFPSLSEGLAYALIEAGAAGLPCIATSVGGLPEIIDDMQTGILIQPRKSQDIAHSIEFYIEHPSIATEHAKAIKQSVQNKFNFASMIEKTIAVYGTAPATSPSVPTHVTADPQTHSQ